MDPSMLKDGQKIKVPEAFLEHGRQKAQRRELIGEWRKYLSTRQREALDQGGELVGYKTRIPLEVMKNLTDAEREELMTHERAEYERLRPLAVAKGAQLRAHVAAGGEAEDFEEIWTAYGRDATIDAAAAASLDRASRSSFPY